jgi:monoamine oxidase
LDIAESTKTATHSWDGRQAIFDPDGKPLPAAKAAALSERVWEIIGEAMAESNKSSAAIPADKSLYDYFKKHSDGLGDDAETFLNLTEMWGAFVGSPVQRQSLKFFWLEECIDGENLFVADTYHKVLQQIAAPALKGANIIFNKKVTRLLSKTGSEISDRGFVVVETSDDETLEFDQVVLTAPLGWLKHNKDAFSPALPKRLTEAIDAISYGTLDKVRFQQFIHGNLPQVAFSQTSISSARQSVME